MKRYLSVFEMITRSSIYKVFCIILAMAVIECASFYVALQQPLASIQPNLEEIVDQSHLAIIFRIAYLLLTVVLVLPGMNIGSMQSYTLRRLRVKENTVFLLHCIYNVLCYLMLWAAQVGLLLVTSNYYMAHKTDAVLTNQTIFLAFHRNRFMHSMLPLQEIEAWFSLILILTGSGLMSALFTKRQREGAVVWLFFPFLALGCICFTQGMASNTLYLSLIAGGFLVGAFLKVFLSEGEEKDAKEK